MTLSEFTSRSVTALESLYSSPEARNIVILLYRNILGVREYSHITDPGMIIPPEKLEVLENGIDRLLKSEPLQYILGYCGFYGRDFKVAPGVLIPRPETEELVAAALKMLPPQGGRVIDLCTGSGCIAWSIFLEAPFSKVTAVDISDDALNIASCQFEGTSPTFVKADVLDPESLDSALGEQDFDILVSNPPYIMEREKGMMRSNVLDFEPGIALFVPDNDPLVFYKAIAAFAKRRKINAGIVEINEKLPEESAQTFRDNGYERVEILHDIARKPRFVKFA